MPSVPGSVPVAQILPQDLPLTHILATPAGQSMDPRDRELVTLPSPFLTSSTALPRSLPLTHIYFFLHEITKKEKNIEQILVKEVLLDIPKG